MIAYPLHSVCIYYYSFASEIILRAACFQSNEIMVKPKETAREFFTRTISENPGIFRTDNKILYCLCCDCALTAAKTSHVKQHIATDKHQKAVKRNSEFSTLKQTFLSEHQRPQQIYSFSMDLCKTFLKANIPLKKISHPSVVNFIEKHTVLFNETMQNLQSKAENKYIWTSIDETTDSEGRMVANFIFGILDGDEESPERGKCYLANMVVEKTNASTMSAFFNDSLLLLWPKGKFVNRVCMFSV